MMQAHDMATTDNHAGWKLINACLGAIDGEINPRSVWKAAQISVPQFSGIIDPLFPTQHHVETKYPILDLCGTS